MGGFTIDGCGATDRFKPIKQLGVFVCPNCKKNSEFTLDEVRRKIDVFFIPTATLSLKYAVMCKNCETGKYISEEEKNALYNGSMTVTISESGIELSNAGGASDTQYVSTNAESVNNDYRDKGTAEIAYIGGSSYASGAATCSQCGAIIHEGGSYCWKCGAEIKKEEPKQEDTSEFIFCSQCGKKIAKEGSFCRYCGCAIDVPKQIAEPFAMIISNALVITGQGLVLTGIVKSGELKTGQQLMIPSLGNEKYTVQSILKNHEVATLAKEGEPVAIKLDGLDVSKRSLVVGQKLVSPDRTGPKQTTPQPTSPAMRFGIAGIISSSGITA